MVARSPVSIAVMGVQGVGKSTLGALLADRLGVAFVDGDSLHPARNIELMASGTPLTDADRAPWLAAVGTVIADAADTGIVVACSALRRDYRDVLRRYDRTLYIVEPWAPIELVRERIAARTHEYMPPSLLQSQYDMLEPLGDDERGIRLSAVDAPEDIVADVLADLASKREPS